MMSPSGDGGAREGVCGGCKGMYEPGLRKPKMLRCYHTFCSSCLQYMQDGRGSVVCRSCHTVTLTNNISGLPDNPYAYVLINNNNPQQLPDLAPLTVTAAGP